VFVPFKNGKPIGPKEDFLTGFVAANGNDVYGRPVGVAFAQDGSLLVADDAGNTIRRVSLTKQLPVGAHAFIKVLFYVF
jgi:glucose/arabinose dehydrogenase